MTDESPSGCDKPDIKEHFKGKCSDEQVIKCHGREALERMKAEQER